MKTVRINIVTLSTNLCNSAEKYLLYKADELFNDHNIKIIDIKKESEKIESLNKKNT